MTRALNAVRRWLRPRRTVTTYLWSGITLDQWRGSDSRISYARRLFASPQGRELLTVLQNSVPMPRLDTPEHASLDAGVVQGYMLCLNRLLSLADPVPKEFPEIEATYDEPELAR